MNINIDRTIEYYNRTRDLCSCDACKNYIKIISKEYPYLEDFLKSRGIDVGKPFETMWLENHKNHSIDYLIVQYVVLGKWENNLSFKLEDLTLSKSYDHPTVNINDDFFVIDICGISLLWGLERPFEEAFTN